MTSQDLPGVRAFGRPVKPVALGFVALMGTLCLTNLLGIGALQTTIWGQIVAVVAGTAAVALMAGWWGRSQRMAEVGLLLSASVYVYRSIAAFLSDPIGVLTFTDGIVVQATFLSIGAAVIAAGSYALERAESKYQRWLESQEGE